jgi:predicted RecA/RadA family phage recombinase
MDNFVQSGPALTFIAPGGGVTHSVPKQIGQVLVIPTTTAAATEKFSGYIRGVFRVTKVGSQAWAEGAVVYWDSGNTRFTTVGAGNLRCGFATLGLGAAMPGSGSGETTGYVYLDGVANDSGT